MKRLFLLVVVLVVAFLALPVSNLIVGLPKTKLAEAKVADPHHQKALTVLGTKCANCHTSEYSLPFYAKLPVAKGIIDADIHKGTEWIDYGKELLPEGGRPVSEVALAKTEHVLAAGTMPPGKYLMLHWNGGLSGEEKETVLTFVKEARKAHYATGTASPEHATDPVQPLPERIDLPAAKVELGERMFHDPRLSMDDTLSCASCHDLGKGGCDQERYAKGVRGQLGGINSPTVFNSGANVRQFWDGRAADLAEQAAGPVENPIEMGAKWDDVVAKLCRDESLVAEFRKLYPEGLTKAAVLDCIAIFEKSLVTPNCPFDRWLSGHENALDAEAKKGYEVFVARGCATCHVGETLGGQSFEKMGRAEDYFEARGNPTDADKGLEGFTKQEGDRHKFKVPTLRNVALTHPWFHDGSQTDLAGAVKIMAKCELGATLSHAEVGQVVEFLESLTGEFRGVPLK